MERKRETERKRESKTERDRERERVRERERERRQVGTKVDSTDSRGRKAVMPSLSRRST